MYPFFTYFFFYLSLHPLTIIPAEIILALLFTYFLKIYLFVHYSHCNGTSFYVLFRFFCNLSRRSSLLPCSLLWKIAITYSFIQLLYFTFSTPIFCFMALFFTYFFTFFLEILPFQLIHLFLMLYVP